MNTSTFLSSACFIQTQSPNLCHESTCDVYIHDILTAMKCPPKAFSMQSFLLLRIKIVGCRNDYSTEIPPRPDNA